MIRIVICLLLSVSGLNGQVGHVVGLIQSYEFDPCGNDKKCKQLTTSQEGYIAASNGWYQITESEADSIFNNLIDVDRGGLENGSGFSATSGRTYQISEYISGSAVDSGDYIIMFHYEVGNSGTSPSNMNPRYSTSTTTGFNVIQGSLPTHSYNSEDLYFVHKGNSFQASDITHIAFSISTNSNVARQSGSNHRYCTGQCSTMTNTGSDRPVYSWYSTSVKQW